jgi:hypothetical protein
VIVEVVVPSKYEIEEEAPFPEDDPETIPLIVAFLPLFDKSIKEVPDQTDDE